MQLPPRAGPLSPCRDLGCGSSPHEDLLCRCPSQEGTFVQSKNVATSCPRRHFTRAFALTAGGLLSRRSGVAAEDVNPVRRIVDDLCQMDALPHGRHHLTPEFVAQNQRDRLLAALPEVLCEEGYEGATVSAVCRRARVSKAAFYTVFSDKNDCFLQAFEAGITQIREQIERACAVKGSWSLRVRAGLSAMLDALTEDPARARFLLIEALSADQPVRDCYRRATESLALHLSRAGPEPPEPRPPDMVLAEMISGGVVSLITREVLGDRGDIRPLVDDLTLFVLAPYVGPGEAKRIAAGVKAA